MSKLKTFRANAMPAPTWHRLRMNDEEVGLPAGLRAASVAEFEGDADLDAPEDAFDAAVAELQTRVDAARAACGYAAEADPRAVARAVREDADPKDLDVPALSAYERRAVAQELAGDVAATFETGAGAEASAFVEGLLAEAGSRVRTVSVAAGATAQAVVRLGGVDGCANVKAVDVVAAPGSHLKLTIALDSPDPGTGVLALRLRVFAGADARIDIADVQTLDDSWLVLDDAGFVLDEGARANVLHTVLGAGSSFTGLAADLRGDGSRIDIDTRYAGTADQTRDFNYVVRHHGRKAECNILANGVLAGRSRKVLRGTIDLVRGCKGSEGLEHETVLLADEGVENKTIPVILCDEDDVAGNHGATIGHVAPEQLFYLETRGLSAEAAESLFATATFEQAAIAVPDARVRDGIARLANERGIPCEEVEA